MQPNKLLIVEPRFQLKQCDITVGHHDKEELAAVVPSCSTAPDDVVFVL